MVAVVDIDKDAKLAATAGTAIRYTQRVPHVQVAVWFMDLGEASVEFFRVTPSTPELEVPSKNGRAFGEVVRWLNAMNYKGAVTVGLTTMGYVVEFCAWAGNETRGWLLEEANRELDEAAVAFIHAVLRELP